jgi:hypothetical protein
VPIHEQLHVDVELAVTESHQLHLIPGVETYLESGPATSCASTVIYSSNFSVLRVTHKYCDVGVAAVARIVPTPLIT